MSEQNSDLEESPMSDTTPQEVETSPEAATAAEAAPETAPETTTVHETGTAPEATAALEPASPPVLVSHLVMGLIFLGIAAFWALQEAAVIDADADWVLPLVLLTAGAAGLVASVVRGTRH